MPYGSGAPVVATAPNAAQRTKYRTATALSKTGKMSAGQQVKQHKVGLYSGQSEADKKSTAIAIAVVAIVALLILSAISCGIAGAVVGFSAGLIAATVTTGVLGALGAAGLAVIFKAASNDSSS